jgi:hypothetical protein
MSDHFFRPAQLARMRGESPPAKAAPGRERHFVAIPQPLAELIVRGHLPLLSRDFGFDHRGEVSVYADALLPVLPDGLVALCRRHGINPDTLLHGQVIGTVDVIEITVTTMVDMSRPDAFGWVTFGQLVWKLAHGKVARSGLIGFRRRGRYWVEQ